jgi:hypothetical protein
VCFSPKPPGRAEFRHGLLGHQNIIEPDWADGRGKDVDFSQLIKTAHLPPSPKA